MSQEDNNVSTNIETNNATIDSTLNETSKTNNNKIIPIIIVILAVLVILGGGFYYYFNNPSRIVTNLINKTYNGFNSMLKNSSEYDIEKDSMILDGNLVIDTNIDGLEDLKKEKINYRVGLDYANKKVEVGAALTEDKTKIIDAILYVINNDAYVTLKDDYDKLINIDTEDFDFNDIFEIESPDITKDDIDYIVKEFKDILIDSIDMEELKKSSDTIKVDGKDKKVNKITYNLTKKNMENFVNSFVDNTLDNKELLEKLAKISDTDVDEIKDNLKDAKDGAFEDFGKLNIYTTGLMNRFVKLELKDDDNELGILCNKDNTEIYIKDTSFTISFKVKDYSSEKIDIDYSIKADSNKVTGNILVSQKEIKNNKYEGTISFKLNYDDYKFNISSDYNLEIGAKVADINTKNAIKYDELNDDEFEEALTNIMKKLQDSNLYDIIENFIPSTNYDYDEDYNYDYDYDFDDDFDYDYSY